MQGSIESTTRNAAVAIQRPPAVALWHRHSRIASIANWKICFATLAVCAALFIALFNPFWVPSGDGDLYVAIARSIVQGEGFKFNGQFVNICPPGWPLVIAGVMKLSPTFGAFKIVTIASMLASLAIWFYVLLRITSPRGAAAVVLMTGILVHTYSLTFWTHSEAFFCAVAALSFLIALQISENRGGLAWRLPLLLALCFGGVMIRWAGILQFLIVCGALMNGTRFWTLPTLPKWVMSIAVIAVSFASFVTLRHVLSLTPQQEIAQREAGAVFDEAATPRPSATADAKKLDLLNTETAKDRTLAGELVRRSADAGTWFSWLFWQPFRFAASVPAAAWLGIVVGWLVITALGAKLVDAVLRFQWLWLGLAAYCAVLCINWPNANARYLVPITPLLFIGVIQGVRLLLVGSIGGMERDRFVAMLLIVAALLVTVVELIVLRRPEATLVVWTLTAAWLLRLWGRSGPADRPARVGQLAVGTFAFSVLLVNGALYAIDLRVARSHDFYAHYEAGFNEQLIQACYQLNQAGLKDAELAVAERYVNLGKVRKSKYAVRAAVLLTGRAVQTVKDKNAGEPKSELLKWCQRRKVLYYLDQRPSVPWRVWHFVLPRWLNEKLVNVPLGADTSGWTLYEIHIDPVPAMPYAAPTNFAQRVTHRVLPLAVPTTQPATRPATEFRRSASKVDLPTVKHWPIRVPGM